MRSVTSLDAEWPDPDRRENALERLLLRVAECELSPAEVGCLQGIASGLTERETAEAFGWNKDSVHKMLERARRLLGAKTSAQAVAIALRAGLIT